MYVVEENCYFTVARELEEWRHEKLIQISRAESKEPASSKAQASKVSTTFTVAHPVEDHILNT